MNIIKEIWEIRGLLDEAVINKEYNKIQLVEDRINQLKNSNEHLKTFATSSIGHFEADSTADKKTNFSKIEKNLQLFIVRYVKGLGCTTRFGDKPQSIAEEIWLARAMFDDFVRKANKSTTSVQDNLMLIDAVEEELQYLATCNAFEKWLSEQEKQSLIDIYKQVLATHHELYGDLRVCRNFNAVSQNY